jgi:hypothetical protein
VFARWIWKYKRILWLVCVAFFGAFVPKKNNNEKAVAGRLTYTQQNK